MIKIYGEFAFMITERVLNRARIQSLKTPVNWAGGAILIAPHLLSTKFVLDLTKDPKTESVVRLILPRSYPMTVTQD